MIESANRLACLLLAIGLLIPLGSHENTTTKGKVLAEAKTFNSAVRNYFLENDTSTGDAGQLGHFVSEYYIKVFAHYQNPLVLKQLSNIDLRALFDVTSRTANLNIENPRYRNEFQSDFQELNNRGLATNQQAREIYLLFFAARLFDQARNFAEQYRNFLFPKLPVIKQEGQLSTGLSTLLVARNGKREMLRRAIDLSHGMKVVLIMSPMCHFARDGLLAINADPKLKRIFEGNNVVWMAQDIPLIYFDQYQKWNNDHPKEAIGVAYLPSEWPVINSWGLPTFYFFKNGILIKKLIGWWPNPPAKFQDTEGNIPNLKKALREVGLLHS